MPRRLAHLAHFGSSRALTTSITSTIVLREILRRDGGVFVLKRTDRPVTRRISWILILFSLCDEASGGITMDEALRRLLSALNRIDLSRVRRRVVFVDGDDDGVADDGILVATNVSMATWNAFAQVEQLPHDLKLRQFLWADNTVWIVECVIGEWHERTARLVDKNFERCLPNAVVVGGSKTLVTPGHATYEPDCSFRPYSDVNGVVVPADMALVDRATVIVEVLHGANWSSVTSKVAVYRQRPGVEYVLCIAISEHMNVWAYSLYDVTEPPDLPLARHSFDMHHYDIATQGHVVKLDSRRVLGLSRGAPLSHGCQDAVSIDMLDLARKVRRV